MISILNGGPRITRPMWTEAVSEAEASGKEEWNIPHIPVQQRERLNDKRDPTVKEHLECISKNWCNYFAESETSSSSASRSKPTTCSDQSWNDQHQWKECPEKSSPFSVAMSLLNIDEHTLTSLLSAPSAFSLRFSSPPDASRTSTTATPLRGVFGRMADWTSNTAYEPNIGLNSGADFTTIYNQVDNFQEKASLGFSNQLAHGRSPSSSRKSVASTVPTVFGSSVVGSFGQLVRDCVSETSLFSQSTRPWKLKSRSVSTINQSMLKGKRDRGQTMRDQENLHKIFERKAGSEI